MKTTADVAVVGAGISGLIAAGELARDRRDVIVLDKGRGVGGRMSTRRHAGGRFDHGAQFITVRSQVFETIMEQWIAAGVAELWSHGFADGQTGDGSIAGSPASEHMPARDGHPRYRGVPGMSAIPKFVATEQHSLDVRLGAQATAVTASDDAVRVTPADGPDFHARTVILTPPVPQTLALLDSGGVALEPTEQKTLGGLAYEPCLVLLTMAGGRLDLPQPGVLRNPSATIAWVADNSRKGVTDRGPALTVHFTADFSREHYEDEPESLLQLLISEAQKALSFEPVEPQLKKWRFSRPERARSDGALQLSQHPNVVLAGDIFSGARVEGAVLSGLAAAERVRRLG